MKRAWIPGLFALAMTLGASKLSADEIKGKVTSIDPDKHTITLSVGDVDKTFDVATDAKVTGMYGKKLKKAVTQDVPGGLKGIKEGVDVTLMSAVKDGKAQVTEVKLEGLQPKIKVKKKKKNKNS
jgi:Cu/Ag efflux protein CusF